MTVPSGACLPRHTRAPVLLSLPQPPAHLGREAVWGVGVGRVWGPSQAWARAGLRGYVVSAENKTVCLA